MGSACLGAVASAKESGVGPVVEMSPVVGKDLGKAKVLPPGRYDEHIHIYEDTPAKPEAFAARIAEAGLVGGCVY